jgi:hypothetical protein
MVPSLRPANSSFSPTRLARETNAVLDPVVDPVGHGLLHTIQSPALVVHCRRTGEEGNSIRKTPGVQGPQARSNWLQSIRIAVWLLPSSSHFAPSPFFRQVTAWTLFSADRLTPTALKPVWISTPSSRHWLVSHLPRPVGLLYTQNCYYFTSSWYGGEEKRKKRKDSHCSSRSSENMDINIPGALPAHPIGKLVESLAAWVYAKGGVRPVTRGRGEICRPVGLGCPQVERIFAEGQERLGFWLREAVVETTGAI